MFSSSHLNRERLHFHTSPGERPHAARGLLGVAPAPRDEAARMRARPATPPSLSPPAAAPKLSGAAGHRGRAAGRAPREAARRRSAYPRRSSHAAGSVSGRAEVTLARPPFPAARRGGRGVTQAPPRCCRRAVVGARAWAGFEASQPLYGGNLPPCPQLD